MKIKADLCETCIFRPGNLMSLRGGRVASMVRDAEQRDSFIVCHETLAHGDGAPDGSDEAACAGYLRNHVPQLLRIAERLDLVEIVP